MAAILPALSRDAGLAGAADTTKISGSMAHNHIARHLALDGALALFVGGLLPFT